MQNEIFFNELCLNNKQNDYSVLTNLKECYQKLKSENFSVCRVDEETKRNVLDYLKGISGVSQTVITGFFFAFFHTPFEKNDISEETEDKFLQHDLYYAGQKATGLQWAYTYDTLAFSLLTNKQWDRDSVVVTEKTEPEKEISIHHAATVANIESQKEWIESLQEIVLVKTNLLPKQKKFSVRADHGTDVLKDFWNKIKNCEYIESCINSLPFNSFDKELIRNINPNGQIELVLYWTDKGLGMVIQTTGRNYRETKEIADILTEKYSK